MNPKHKHHIVPKHMGGTDSPDNITPPISVQLHAALHKDLYEHVGKTQDFVAWKLLSGQALKGIIHTPEVRQKISNTLKGRYAGDKNPACKPGVGKKISERKTGHPIYQDVRWIESNRQAGLRRIGTKQTPEVIERRIAPLRGRKRTAEFVEALRNRSSQWWIITFPDRHFERIWNPNEFCRTHGLEQRNMSAVGRGKRTHHKGYKCRPDIP